MLGGWEAQLQSRGFIRSQRLGFDVWALGIVFSDLGGFPIVSRGLLRLIGVCGHVQTIWISQTYLPLV